MTPEAIIQVLAPIGVIIGFFEWRFRSIHKCMVRIESRLDKHIDK